ncbi:MAG: holo-ACP synthase [Treponema sp.]|nr:holo-ACP synthase [Treponema sp.]
MIFGIGCDIVCISRLQKWIKNPDIIKRYFHPKEIASESMSEQRLCEYYAVRFAAKEAFSKALGTGLRGFELSDIHVEKNINGKPDLFLENKARSVTDGLCGKNSKIHLSLSHEKEYALAYVVIEKEV